MSTIATIRRSVKVSPVKVTRVLFDATVTHAAPRTFGRGLLRSLPTFVPPASLEEQAWAAQEFNAVVTAEDRHFDELALESAMLDRYTRGHVM